MGGSGGDKGVSMLLVVELLPMRMEVGGTAPTYDLMARLVVVEYVFEVSQYTPSPQGT